MFKLSEEPSWTWPVRVKVPAYGKHEEQTFEAQFRLIPSDEAAKILEADPSAMSLMRRALIGWSGVMDDRSQAVPFSEEARDKLLSVAYAFAAVAAAYTESLTGAARKN